jgi:ABC-2 type transport system permease protein
MSISNALVYQAACSWRNQLRLLRHDSRFKVFFIGLVFTAFFLGIRLLFLSSFRFMDDLGGLSSLIISHLFALFFLGLGLMMVVSGIVTSYSTLYDSPEVPFLLTTPATPRQIVMGRVAESILLSSWAFFFIIIPFIAAYQAHKGLSPLFLLWSLLFAVPFLVLTAGLGSLLVLAALRWIPRGRSLLAAALIVLALAGVATVLILLGRYRHAESEEVFVLTNLVPGMKAASQPFWPSWWMSEGIMAGSRGLWGRGLLFLLLLTSHALLVLTVIEELGAAAFYESWQRATGESAWGRRAPILLAGLERAAARLLPPDLRALAFKDMRTFLRDPAQWAQSLIFFGLLGLYFFNLRTFRYNLMPEVWRSFIAFLNVFSVSAVLCSLGARFVYPQLSLEGHGFWILNLAPTTPRRILFGKFALSALAMLLISLALVLLSTTMLEVTTPVRLVTLGVGLAVPVAVAGLSTGLGALFMDLRERNPAAIVSGFGGTLNLVLSLAYMLLAILPFAALFHQSLLGRLSPPVFHRGVAAASLWCLALTAAAAVLPLFLANRSLTRRDY